MGRFMESLDDSEIVRCGYEPLAVARRTESAAAAAHSKTWRIFRPHNQRASVLERGGAPPLWTDRQVDLEFLRFMESVLDSTGRQFEPPLLTGWPMLFGMRKLAGPSVS